MKQYVIEAKNIARVPPVFSTITTWLLLDRLHASGIVWGIVGTLFGILWIVALVVFFQQKPVDLTEFLRERHKRMGAQ